MSNGGLLDLFGDKTLHSCINLADVKLGKLLWNVKTCCIVVTAHISSLKTEIQEGCRHVIRMLLCLGPLCVSQSLYWLKSKKQIRSCTRLGAC